MLVLDKLKSAGIHFKTTATVASTSISGKSFVFTGALQSLAREEAKRLVLSRGGLVHSSISPKTDYVVAGEAAGSKLEKAIKHNLNILSEEQFLKMISS